MQPPRRNALRLLLVGLATAACSEQTAPTAIPDGVNAAVAAAAGGQNQKVKVKTMQLASNTLRIDGPSVAGQVSIGNSGVAIPTGVVLRGELTQGASSRQAVNATLQCSGGSPAGKLPTGSCEMTFAASASNSATGTGPALAPGSATFILRVIQTGSGGDIELASKTLLVNLTAAPSIAALALQPNVLTIEGPSAPFSATLQNPANGLQGVSLEAWVVQGSNRRIAGTALVTCGSAAGVLPAGSCSTTSLAKVSHYGVSTPTFVPGEGVLEVYLVQNTGGVVTPLDTATLDIRLTHPIISLLTLESSTAEINGAVVNYTVKLSNEGSPVSNVLLQGELVQTQATGLGTTKEVSVAAGGTLAQCGGPLGFVPSGICTMQFAFVASTSSSGNGTLQPGPATFHLHLQAPPNAFPTFDWSVRREPVTLTSPAPTLTSVVPTSTNVVLSPPIGLATQYTATISNPGVARSVVTLQAEIKQGSAQRGVGGSNVRCGGNAGAGLLPSGTCVETLAISAYNLSGFGDPLVPGPATLEVTLYWSDGTTSTILDQKLIDITLVPGATITNINVPQPSILIGESTSYTATLNNPFATAISGLTIRGLLDQGDITSIEAGTTTVQCSGQSAGQLGPGTCTVSSTMSTATNGGTHVWQEAPATFRLQLMQGGAVLDEKTVTVNLYRLF